MRRKFLFSFYDTPHGRLLQDLEKQYLRKAITTSYKQTILQLGGLGWENDFIDCTLYTNYCILDENGYGYNKAIKINVHTYRLPIKSETVSLVILPHLLEFDPYRFQTIREVERILKPAGKLIVLNFNPINTWVRLHYFWDIKMSDQSNVHFIARSRISDWLKILNFAIKPLLNLL